MLKWTASVQKLNASEMPIPTPKTNDRMAAMSTPQQQQRRQRRRATIGHNGCDKENMLPVTSTPIVPQPASLLRLRNSPLVLAPLADILNVTPEHSPQTAHRGNGSGRRRRSVISIAATPTTTPIAQRSTRRHSTVGFSLPPPMTEYAPTLPCYEEEEYSPSTHVQQPTGQELALRGLMPVPFLTTMRYFQTPELLSKQQQKQQQQQQTQSEALKQKKSLPQKRKLEEEFAQIAQECSDSTSARETAPKATTTIRTITTTTTTATVTALRRTQQPELGNVTSTTSSAKMGDQTLDRLIDAILDSARKEEKRKKPRKSFNLRRRTLLKNQTVHEQQEEQLLSPSYAACDDPASDLSFLLCDTALEAQPKTTPIHYRTTLATLKQQPTPAPATPLPGTPIPLAVLQQMPTPVANFTNLTTVNKTLKAIANHSHDSFNLETPVRALSKRRRQQQQQQHLTDESGSGDLMGGASKKFKADAHNYFEVGLALPSIYV